MDTQIFNMMCVTVGTSMAMQATQSLDKVIALLVSYLTLLYDKIKKWWKGPINTVTIERIFDNSPDDVNNKILIDALLYGCNEGFKFKANNKALEKKYENEYEREKSRKIFVRKDETFKENEITVITQLKMKTVSSEKKRDGNDELKEVPDREIITLTSRKPIAEIVKFIEEKKNAYISKMCSQQSILSVFTVALYGTNHNQYNRVTFGSEKIFDSWFIPEKEEFMKLIQDFENNTGAYAIPGVQKKLILLLHGRPGCGKSSFTKALANRLQRHLFPVALDKFKGIVPFQRFFYNENIINDTTQNWEYVPFKKRIIVFEEIDTAGAIVMDREKIRSAREHHDDKWLENFSFFGDYTKKKTSHKMNTDKNKRILERKRVKMRLDYNKERVNLETELKGQVKKEQITKETMEEQLGLFDEKVKLESDYLSDSMPDENLEKNEKSDDDIFNEVMQPKNNIHLGDILNIFDGITELKDFVCVITTNHKEYLDPALVRPGRITYKIRLEKMRTREIEQMLSFYYIKHDCQNENLPIEVKTKMISVIALDWDGQFTPSKIETTCLHTSLESLHQQVFC